MGCYKYKRYRKRENNFPAELAEMKVPKGSEMKVPKGSEWKEVKKGQINVPYIFRDTEWRF